MLSKVRTVLLTLVLLSFAAEVWISASRLMARKPLMYWDVSMLFALPVGAAAAIAIAITTAGKKYEVALGAFTCALPATLACMIMSTLLHLSHMQAAWFDLFASPLIAAIFALEACERYS